jgi:small subunit ribosomal protein S16
MLTIRLQRTGKRNQPEFRIVLAQKTAAASKKFVEVLGSYNPRNKQFALKDEARVKYWIAQHAELSPTIHNLFVAKSLLEAKKVRAFNVPKKPAVEEVPAPEKAASAETPAATPEQSSAEAPVQIVEQEAATDAPAVAAEESAPTPTEPEAQPESETEPAA